MGKFLLVVIVFAAVVYALFWLLDRRRERGADRARRSQTVPRPVAPDDDDTFLRELDRRRRRDGNTGNPPDPSGPGPA